MCAHVALGLHIISRASLGATWEGAIPKVGLVEPRGGLECRFRIDWTGNRMLYALTILCVLC